MFIAGGILISGPGGRIGAGVQEGIQAGTLAIAQYAAVPLLVALTGAVVLALFMKETYPNVTVRK